MRLPPASTSQLLAVLGAAASLIAASPALAADTFVNQSTGSNSNDCLSAASACLTISGATGGVAKAGPNDDVHVAPGTYTEEVTLAAGKSLRATGAAAATIIASSSTIPAITVTGAAGTIEGFTIRAPNSSFAVLRLEQNADVRNNVFDGDSVASKGDVWVNFFAGSATVSGNTFHDPDITDKQTAISINTPTTVVPTVEDNRISDYFKGIQIDRGVPLIRANEISGTHASTSPGVAIAASPAGNDPVFDSVSPLIVGNVIRDGVVVGPNAGAAGIEIFGDLTPGGATFGARLRRNRISSHSPGVQLAGTDGEVTLNGDTIVGAPVGLFAFENDAGTLGDVTATNVTIVGSPADVVLQHTHLTLDSSIVSQPISTNATTATCSITNSRGPTTTPGGNGCGDFQTTADPMFVNAPSDPGPDDLHLEPTSPLIDAGNAAAPEAGILDLDGEPRAIGMRCGWTERRDIGADEVSACTPAETEIASGPANGSVLRSAAAEFAFSNAAMTDLECSLDGAPFAACTSPRALTGLADGSHTFAVRGKDSLGSVDLSPATRTWTVDTTAPDTQIDSGPADGAVTQERSADYGFSSEAGASFECSIDGGAFVPCTSPTRLSDLADGDHSIAVRATDAVGNTDPSPARRSIRVVRVETTDQGGQGGQGGQADTDAPETTLRKPRVRGAKVRLRFSSDEAGSTFRCKLDRRKFAPCSSPRTYRKLRRGKHRVLVVATDAAGNTDPTPARRTFRVAG